MQQPVLLGDCAVGHPAHLCHHSAGQGVPCQVRSLPFCTAAEFCMSDNIRERAQHKNQCRTSGVQPTTVFCSMLADALPLHAILLSAVTQLQSQRLLGLRYVLLMHATHPY